MATHQTRPEFIDAIQLTSTNGLDIQAIAGEHPVDAAGHYNVPNFDYKEYWWPNHPDPAVVAVLWDGVQWQPVRIGDFLIRNPDGTLSVNRPDEFNAKYEAV